ncbi:MAG: right-handed parallel beta-helix repeat-containing protein, partial [Bacilli bacterium]|nr:right-handed parallel beta-helix repeat-containing protein [Bacilli bacterium]
NNEIYNANHVGISYSGLYHVIENNIIHDVCRQSEDAGAIYAGRSWTSYGNIIRNNVIFDLGNGSNKPHGIYLDDALSGQIVYGNLLVNIPGKAILMGGGRDLSVYNNIVVNAGDQALFYDARAREGVLTDAWFSDHVKPGGDMWGDLNDVPWKGQEWQKEFPQYQDLADDFSNLDDPHFFPNPANSDVVENLVFDKRLSIGSIDEDVYQYSNISGNPIKSFGVMEQYFIDYQKGDYHLKANSAFKDKSYIDLNQVGRY